MDKEYIAELKLGVETDTWDIEGKILAQKSAGHIGRREIMDTAVSMVGDYFQVPPAYSAKKIQGKPAYYYIRSGKKTPGEIILSPVKVKINNINLLFYSGNIAGIKISCSSGTYVRSIVHDIGKRLGCGAVLTGLARTKIGDFDLNLSLGLNEILQIAEKKKLNLEEIISLYKGIINIEYCNFNKID